jgi:opacity protein-like surface antigen
MYDVKKKLKNGSCKITGTALVLICSLTATSLFAGEISSGGGSSSVSFATPAPGLRSGAYMSTDAGVNLLSDFRPSGSTASAVASDFGLTGLKLSFSPGVRWDISAGYAFKLGDNVTLAAELETGIIYNSFDKASAKSGDSTITASVNGELLQVPLMVNGILNWQFASNWIIYAGGGVGADFSFTSTDNNASRIGDTFGSETDFGWQGMGGIKYHFGFSDIGIGYKYLGFTPSGAKTLSNNDILASYALHF